MKTIGQEFFKGQNWLITPVAFAVDDPRPTNVYDQRCLLVLTGGSRDRRRGVTAPTSGSTRRCRSLRA